MELDLYNEFFALEGRHWWFLGRRKLFMTLIRKYFGKRDDARILDVGCGTGMNMDGLAEFGTVYGMDGSQLALEFCRKRGFERLTMGHMYEIPFSEKSFDLVTAFDVVEHEEDDRATLRGFRDLLREGGQIVLSVPAYMFMWGEHDDAAHHKRRYTVQELASKVRESGFQVLKVTYFNFWLFPLAVAFRYMKRWLGALNKRLGRELPLKSDFIITSPPVINPIFQAIFATEAELSTRVDFPYGASIVIVAQKI
ncbi:MAG: class I SAM-dependent methyltransferase [Candidatus Methylomirabilis sp.]|nr:class I SAM-dependent methyltransferase [Deltaproteobacteria bacterium]